MRAGMGGGIRKGRARAARGLPVELAPFKLVLGHRHPEESSTSRYMQGTEYAGLLFRGGGSCPRPPPPLFKTLESPSQGWFDRHPRARDQSGPPEG